MFIVMLCYAGAENYLPHELLVPYQTYILDYNFCTG